MREGLILVAFLCGFLFAESKVRALVRHLGQIRNEREFEEWMHRLERTQGWVSDVLLRLCFHGDQNDDRGNSPR